MENWYAKVTVTVIGPKEGPVNVSAEYTATSREQAQLLQDKLAELGIQLNKLAKKSE